MSERGSFGAIEIVQIHDAVVKELQVLAGGRVSIQFAGVSVYRSVSSHLYDVWIHDAKLMMAGVTMLSVDGSWHENDDDYVLDDDVYTISGETVSWLNAAAAEIHYIRFSLFSGAHIGIACKQAILSLAEAGELVGQWEDFGESPA